MFLFKRKTKTKTEEKARAREPASYRLRLNTGHMAGLQFEDSWKISHNDCELSSYSYTLNGKSYTGVSCLNVKENEEIGDQIYIREDQYGSKVLCVVTDIPTFDSGDREWDSYMTEYLMFDGRDINLIVKRGGYKIASLTFYTKLTAADVELKDCLERLGFPVEQIEWREPEKQ